MRARRACPSISIQSARCLIAFRAPERASFLLLSVVRRVPHFLVMEEDAELGLLLASRYDWLQAVLSALPASWAVLQCAVIAELPWLRHLQSERSSDSTPIQPFTSTL